MASPAFTMLTENSTNTTMTPPKGFDPMTAWLMAQCCAIAYTQYDSGNPPDFSGLTLVPGQTSDSNITAGTPVVLTVSEALGPESSPGNNGSYTTLPIGFVVQITLAKIPTGSTLPTQFIVVVLRGTQSWDEWIDDAETYPTTYPGWGGYFWDNLPLVHGGLFGLYVNGTDGLTGTLAGNTQADRAAGSIAAQIAQFFNPTAPPTPPPPAPPVLPVYVTGHSLGGALATYCALDIAANFSANVAPSTVTNSSNAPYNYNQQTPIFLPNVSMYSLASPRAAMGLNAYGVNYPTGYFIGLYFCYVPYNFQIANACDIIPILPPSTLISNSSLAITAAQVTDPDPGTYTGNGYLGAVSFCVQTGEIGNNHGCINTYLPYVAWLAAQ